MSIRIHFCSELDPIDISLSGSVIWIRKEVEAGRAAVSLDLSRDDRAMLRAWLDQADAIADKT